MEDEIIETTEIVDLTPILDKMDNLTDLLYVSNIFIFAILIFMTFKLALRGLWK